MSGNVIFVILLAMATLVGVFFISHLPNWHDNSSLLPISIVMLFMILGSSVRFFSDFQMIRMSAEKNNWGDVKIRYQLFPGTLTSGKINSFRYYSVEYTDTNGYKCKKRCKANLVKVEWIDN